MDFDRIRSSLDVERMQRSRVSIIGGAVGLAADLVHCGLGAVHLIDFDRIDESNIARQDFDSFDIGRYKVEAVTARLKRLNPEVKVDYQLRDFCELSAEEVDQNLGQSDLLIFATDSFSAQARGNVEAIRLSRASIWIGLYRGARAGEVIFTAPGVTRACFRCIASSRYAAFEQHAEESTSPVKIPSSGGTIMDLRLTDAISGQIALGLLTRGADNRFGRLIDQLGQRNLLQLKIDPTYTLGDPDLFAKHLGTDPANFSFNTIAMTMEPEADCPDCAHLRSASQLAAFPDRRNSLTDLPVKIDSTIVTQPIDVPTTQVLNKAETPCRASTAASSRGTHKAGRSRSGRKK